MTVKLVEDTSLPFVPVKSTTFEPSLSMLSLPSSVLSVTSAM